MKSQRIQVPGIVWALLITMGLFVVFIGALAIGWIYGPGITFG